MPAQKQSRMATSAAFPAIEAIRRKFESELRRKPSTDKLDRLVRGGSVRITPTELRSQSIAHHRHTLNLLKLIDTYAKAHAREHGRIGAGDLPSEMRKVLERYSLRAGLNIDQARHGLAVARAFEAHRRRIGKLYAVVGDIKQKHGI